MDTIPNPPETATEGGEAGTESPGEFVTISRAELDALRAAAKAPEPDDRAARGREEQAARDLAAKDRRLAELEESCKSAVRERELATALVGRPLVAGAAAQLVRLWRDEFDVYEEEGTFKVSSKDGRAVAQVVGDRLASAEYSHFCLPSSRGGTGARDANRPSAASPAAAPKNLGESIVMRWRDESAARPESLLKPIGLRRHR